MNIRYRPQIHLPDNEENESKNTSSKAQKTELILEQNQINEMSAKERFEELRRQEQLEKKCAAQEAHHKQFNDEDRKELRQREKEKLARELDQYKKLNEDDSDPKNRTKKKRVFIDDDEDQEHMFQKINNNREKIKNNKSLRMKKRASLQRG